MQFQCKMSLISATVVQRSCWGVALVTRPDHASNKRPELRSLRRKPLFRDRTLIVRLNCGAVKCKGTIRRRGLSDDGHCLRTYEAETAFGLRQR